MMSTRIHIGNQTAFSAKSAMLPFEFALASGFDAFEWFEDKKPGPNGAPAGWDALDMDTGTRAQIRTLAGERGMTFSVHAPWQANPLLEGGPARLCESIDFAREIGASLMNLHLYIENGPGVYVERLLPVLDYAAEKGVRLSLENTVQTSPADINGTFALLRSLGARASHTGLCLDIGHANVRTQGQFIRFMDAIGAEVPLIHLHVHENRGDKDSHLTLFSGPSAADDTNVRGFISRLKKRGYSGAMILEQWPQPPELLTTAEKRLRELLNETAD